MNKIRKTIKKGFTLIELVVVIAVIAILSAVSVVTYLGVTDSANKSNATSAATQLRTLLLTEVADGIVSYDTDKLGNEKTANQHFTYSDGALTPNGDADFDALVTVIEKIEGTDFGTCALVTIGTKANDGFTLTTSNGYVAKASFAGGEVEVSKQTASNNK